MVPRATTGTDIEPSEVANGVREGCVPIATKWNISSSNVLLCESVKEIDGKLRDKHLILQIRSIHLLEQASFCFFDSQGKRYYFELVLTLFL